MKITDVKIRNIFDTEPVKAIVSVTLDGQLAVHDIKVIHSGGRTFIAMPSRKTSKGGLQDVVHPVHAAFRAELENTVLEAYYKASQEKE